MASGGWQRYRLCAATEAPKIIPRRKQPFSTARANVLAEATL
jgi:hypothetical protein